MAADADLTLVRDAMLTRMAMATPGGPLFRDAFPRIPIQTLPAAEMPVRDMNLDKFDEAQSYAAGRKGLIAHTALMRLLAQAAVTIREQLAAGEPVIIVSGGRELVRLEP